MQEQIITFIQSIPGSLIAILPAGPVMRKGPRLGRPTHRMKRDRCSDICGGFIRQTDTHGDEKHCHSATGVGWGGGEGGSKDEA